MLIIQPYSWVKEHPSKLQEQQQNKSKKKKKKPKFTAGSLCCICNESYALGLYLLRDILFLLDKMCILWCSEFVVYAGISSGNQMLVSWIRITAAILMMMPMVPGVTRGILSFLGITALFLVVSIFCDLFQVNHFKYTACPLKWYLNQRWK